MREILESVAGDLPVYEARREEYNTGQAIPFRVTASPFYLSKEQANEVGTIGVDITGFFHAADELYRTEGVVHELLDTGKPDIFLLDRPAEYIFVRPDMVITEDGFAVCEIETSPFGLALADILNRAYIGAGFETVVGEKVLETYLKASTPNEGTVVFSNKTKSYAGQMEYLARRLLSGAGRNWRSSIASDTDLNNAASIYRGFYLSEIETDPSIKILLDSSDSRGILSLPSHTPHIEEKAILSFIWDKRFEKKLKSQLGAASYAHLRRVIPPTWIVGQEKYFAPGLPNGYESSADLAKLSRRARAFVLKSSGFSSTSSWAEGVYFLGKKSAVVDEEMLLKAAADKTALHVVQAMRKGKDYRIQYTEDGRQIPMNARIRLTPYFATNSSRQGELVAAKATGCENTDLIHASSSSINAAVAVV